jgi:hypothetical protein
MKPDPILFALALALALGSCTAPPPPPQPQGPPLELAGRTAGGPQNCVTTTQLDVLRPSENAAHVMLYGSGRTIWANNLGSCRFGYDDILVMQMYGPQLCRGDIVRSIDRLSRIPGPACVLNDFVPYTR